MGFSWVQRGYLEQNMAITHEIVSQLSREFSGGKEPFLLLIGGFQGSGKSSLIRRIKAVFEINVISTDVIRQSLFDRGWKVSPEFSKTVDDIFKSLLCKSMGSPTVIDANAHAKRILDIEAFMKEKECKTRVLKVFLSCPPEVLKKRVVNRERVSGCYQGTLSDLESSLAITKIDEKDYDLCIETDKLNEEEVTQLVLAKLPHEIA